MVTIFLQGGVSICTLVYQVHVEYSCCHQACQEPYNGKRQQLHYLQLCIQRVERNVLCGGHQLLEIRQRVIQLFPSSKQPSRCWFRRLHLPQSWWLHRVPHATACVHGKYVVCSSKGVQWCWESYLLRSESKRLVVEWTRTLVEFCHSYDDFSRFVSTGGCLALQLSLCSAVQTRHCFQRCSFQWCRSQQGEWVYWSRATSNSAIYLSYSTLGQLWCLQSYEEEVFQHLWRQTWSMVTMFLWGGALTSTAVSQLQLEPSRDQWAFQEYYHGNCHQLHLVPDCIQMVAWNVLCHGHRLLEI